MPYPVSTVAEKYKAPMLADLAYFSSMLGISLLHIFLEKRNLVSVGEKSPT